MRLSAFLLLFFCSVALFSKAIPTWVSAQQNGTNYAVADTFYFGIGSGNSFKISDANAREDFAQMVAVHVKSKISQKISEKNKTVEENIEINSELSTEISLRGIEITSRFYEAKEKCYYSLIQIVKEDYNQRFEQELNLAFERKKAKLEQAIKEQKLLELKEKEAIRQQWASLELEKEKRAQKYAEIQHKKEKYHRFYRYEKRAKFVKMYTPFLSDNIIRLENRANVDPFSIEEAQVDFRLARIQFTLLSKHLNHYEHDLETLHDIFTKVLLMDEIGEINKYSFSIGFRYYDISNRDDDFPSLQEKSQSVMLSISSTIPALKTIFSAQVERRIVGFGFETLLYKDVIRLFNEFVYLSSENRPVYKRKYYVNCGISLKTSTSFDVSFTFENSNEFRLGLAWGF